MANCGQKTFIDLFCGAGGLSVGFTRAGFRCVLANDIEQDFCETFRLNHPGTEVIRDDIKKVTARTIFSHTGFRPGEIDLFVGGPPCQGFSTIGKRWLKDPRNKLFREYFRLVGEMYPKVFVFENVTGLLTMGGGSVFSEIVRLFSELGYVIKWKVLNAARFGVPQHRERVFIVGSLIKDRIFEFPKPTHNDIVGEMTPGLMAAPSIREAVSDLPLIKCGQAATRYATSPQNDYQAARRGGCTTLTHHEAPNHGESLMRVIRHVPEGGALEDIPRRWRPKKAYPNSYSRLWWDRPSTTLTRNFGTPSSARCIHPICHRGLTTREGARLQSFDDSYQFVGSRSSRNLQIGNAVPPILAEAVAKEVMRLFDAAVGSKVGAPRTKVRVAA